MEDNTSSVTPLKPSCLIFGSLTLSVDGRPVSVSFGQPFPQPAVYAEGLTPEQYSFVNEVIQTITNLCVTGPCVRGALDTAQEAVLDVERAKERAKSVISQLETVKELGGIVVSLRNRVG